MDVVRHVPAWRSPIPRSSSAIADPLGAGGRARNLTISVGSTERTRVTVTPPGWFALPGHGTCAAASGSGRDCVLTITGGGSGTRRIAAGTPDIAIGVDDRPGIPALTLIETPHPAATA